MPTRSLPAFAIGIPARNEAASIARCLESVLASANALPAMHSCVRIAVACDSCDDGTASVAAIIASRDSRVEVLEGEWQSAGACRAAAIQRALDDQSVHLPPQQIWVATTDADTLVPVDWLATHAASWARGDHAVAGIVDLLSPDTIVAARFRRHYTLPRHREGDAPNDAHGHVHGANLGIRSDAYLAVGGFPSVSVAEDHALWIALRAAGFTCRPSLALRVLTSARLHGRASGGFADGLRSLILDPPIAERLTVTA